VVRSPITVWLAFVAAHLWLGLLNLFAPGQPMGDVTNVYPYWIELGAWGHRVGIDGPWVYPLLAWLPILLAAAAGIQLYAASWLTMVLVLNAVAFGFVTGWGRRPERVTVGWWWIGFLVLLGPIALGRIDAVTVAVAMIGVLLLGTRPRVAALLLTVGAWMKVWPGGLLLAAVIGLRSRWRMLVAAVAFTVLVIGVSLALGSGVNVLGFITEQTGRGLQVESPAATLWLWRALLGEAGTYVAYDYDILTYQVSGDGVETIAALTTPALAIVIAVLASLGVIALRRGVAPGDLVPALGLGMVTALIAVNKVGSPQFVAWLAVPIVLGIATRAAGHGRSFRTPAALVLAIAGLTQFIYPYLYRALLMLDPLMLVVITVRNGLYLVVLGWTPTASGCRPCCRDAGSARAPSVRPSR
jgi:hypothetical protein